MNGTLEASSYLFVCGKVLAAPYRSGESPSFKEGVLQIEMSTFAVHSTDCDCSRVEQKRNWGKSFEEYQTKFFVIEESRKPEEVNRLVVKYFSNLTLFLMSIPIEKRDRRIQKKSIHVLKK